MGEKGVVGKHLPKVAEDSRGAAEKETVDPGKMGGAFPEDQEEKQQESPAKGNIMVMEAM